MKEKQEKQKAKDDEVSGRLEEQSEDGKEVGGKYGGR